MPLEGGYTNPTSGRTEFYLQGQEGYQNGINELNNICAIYGNGEEATGARSITVDDINKITGYNPNNVGVYDPEQTGSGTKYGEGTLYEYGNRVTFYWDGTDFPYYKATNGLKGNLTTNHNNNLFGNCFYWYDEEIGWQSLPYTAGATTGEMKEIITLKGNYYGDNPITLDISSNGDAVGISTNSVTYKLLFANNSTGAYTFKTGATNEFCYYLGTKYITTGSVCTGFGVRKVDEGNLNRI